MGGSVLRDHGGQAKARKCTSPSEMTHTHARAHNNKPSSQLLLPRTAEVEKHFAAFKGHKKLCDFELVPQRRGQGRRQQS